MLKGQYHYFDQGVQRHTTYVDHNILLSKLEKYGIRETELLFFKNYLTGRKQYTVFYDTVSEWLEILCGVPQGSILGPLLFIIYINDFQTLSILKQHSLQTTLHL